jgi:hypothetical protein
VTYINVAAIVTKALTKTDDTSTALRAKYVSWFNEVARDVLNQPRKWNLLTPVPVVIAIVANQITLPATASEIISIEAEDLFLTPKNQISEQDAFEDDYKYDLCYTLANGVVTFYPSATGNATLTYELNKTTDYTDVSTATIFPIEFENLFITGIRLHHLNDDDDDRYTTEVFKYAAEMKQVKAQDNKLNPRPQTPSQGYTRTKK